MAGGDEHAFGSCLMDDGGRQALRSGLEYNPTWCVGTVAGPWVNVGGGRCGMPRATYGWRRQLEEREGCRSAW